MINIKDTVEYKLISNHYGDRVAQRSQVRLMNHIDEGLEVLDCFSASEAARRAFCMHPLLQADEDLKENWYMARMVEPHVLLLTMEYRNIANAYLSDKMDAPYHIPIKLSPLYEVNEMLRADKVQNRKDFITYHKGTHPRSAQLDLYFKQWLEALDISEETYNNLCEDIDASKL